MGTIDQDWTQLKLLGGSLCLDFVNTVDRSQKGYTEDWLVDYTALVAWGQYVQIVTPDTARQILDLAHQEPDLAIQAWREAIALRETIHRLFTAIAAQKPLSSEDLAIFNSHLHKSLRQLQVVPNPLISHPLSCIWEWKGIHLEMILWLVVRSTAELLTTPFIAKVRACAAPDCGWIFVDISRNHRRRWCDMESCGNRSKAQRHYQKNKLKTEK